MDISLTPFTFLLGLVTIASYYGGPMSAGQAYLVGDDHGRPTPYSEIFVPHTPGVLFGVEQTRQILSQQTQVGGNTNNFYVQDERHAYIVAELRKEQERDRSAFYGVN